MSVYSSITPGGSIPPTVFTNSPSSSLNSAGTPSGAPLSSQYSVLIANLPDAASASSSSPISSSNDAANRLNAVNAVFFPHRRCVDVIIHYAGTDFHVHQQVLYHHSAYFRRHLEGSAAADSSGPASNRPRRCNHPHIAHCIHLPQQTTLVAETVVTADDFQLFLCHLYFSAHYCYPPFLPKTDIDLDAESPPLCQTFPAVTSLDWSDKSPQLRISDEDGNRFAFNEALLTLAHYLECSAMMQQCETVLLTQEEWNKTVHNRAWLARSSLWWLLKAETYKLHKCRRACIRAIANAPDSVREEDVYKSAKQQWDKEVLLEMVEAMQVSLQSKR